jgi:hypothetical protein
MNFPLGRAGLNDSDLNKVYRYVPRETTVVRFLTTDPVCLLLIPLDLNGRDSARDDRMLTL